MATVTEEAAPAAMVGAGEKAEAAAALEKVDEVKEAGAGEEEMEVAAGEAKKAAMVGAGEKAEAVAPPEQVDEVKEAGAGEEEMEVAAGEAEEGNEAKKAEGEQEQGKGKEKRPRSRKPRPAGPHHPPYFEMIKEAIMAAGDGKAGASAYAIAKRVGERHGEALPGNYRKVLAARLRSFAAKGRLVRVKASFRLAPAEEKKALQAARPARPKRAKKAGPPAKPKAKQPKSIRARKANKASAA